MQRNDDEPAVCGELDAIPESMKRHEVNALFQGHNLNENGEKALGGELIYNNRAVLKKD